MKRVSIALCAAALFIGCGTPDNISTSTSTSGSSGSTSGSSGSSGSSGTSGSGSTSGSSGSSSSSGSSGTSGIGVCTDLARTSSQTFSSAPAAIAAADFTGGGKAELVLGVGPALQIYAYEADGGLGNPQTLSQNTDGYFSEALPVDLTGDGKPDVAADDILPDGGAELDVFVQSGSSWQKLGGEGEGVFSLAKIDIHGDGGSDVIGTTPSGLQPLLNDGSGRFTRPAPTSIPSNVNGIAAGDFNGDGIGDVAAVTTNPDGVDLFLGNGDGSFRAGTSLSAGPMSLSIVAADFNHDGKLDLAVVNGGDQSFQNASVAVYPGKGDGTFLQPVAYPISQGWAGLAVGDFDGNGTKDLAAVISEGSVGLFLNDGNGTFTAEAPYGMGTALFGLAAGDFNGNGVADVAAVDGPHSKVVTLFDACQ